MKKRFFWMLVITTLVIGAGNVQPLAAKAKADKDDSQTTIYNNKIPYGGVFIKDAIYKRPSPTATPRVFAWQGSRDLTRLTQIRCTTARNEINIYGNWTGNLDLKGNCLDPGEPMQWALGNYLNFLQSQPKSNK